MSLWRFIVSVFLLLIPLPLSAITVTRYGVSISDDEWKKISESAAARIEADYKVLSDPQKQERVDRLAEQTGTSYRHPVKILDTEEVNAFCLPGDRIYVTKGLVDIADDRELCFALYHEQGHSIKNDPEEKIKNSLMIQAAFAEAGLKGVEKIISSLIVGIFESSYSRDKERQADAYAVNEMIESREDPEGAISLLTKLIEIRKEKGIGTPGGLGKYYASHPPPERRIELIRDIIDKAKKEGLLRPVLYEDHPILLLISALETEGIEHNTRFSKPFSNEFQKQGKFKFIPSWNDCPKNVAFDKSLLCNWAKNKGAEYFIWIRITDQKEEMKFSSNPFWGKDSVKASLKIQGVLIDLKSDKTIKEIPLKDWQFEQKSRKALDRFIEARDTLIREMISELLQALPFNTSSKEP